MTRITIEADDELLEEVAHGIAVRAQQIHDNPDDEFEVTAEALKEIGNDLLYETMSEDVEPLTGAPEEQFTLTIESDETDEQLIMSDEHNTLDSTRGVYEQYLAVRRLTEAPLITHESAETDADVEQLYSDILSTESHTDKSDE